MWTDHIRKVSDFIKTFNLYENNRKLSQVDQCVSTRIFIGLLLFSILVIILSTGFTIQTRFVTIDSPSEDLFKEFSIQYSGTLTCLCQQTSISHSEIVSFHPEFHPICSSQFINQTFLLSLADINVSEYWPVDYRLMVSSHIQLLQTFCRMIKEKIDDVIQKFSSQYLISAQALSYDNFRSQMSTLVNQFQQNTITTFSYINDFIWLNIFYNRLLSGLRSNTFIRYASNPTIGVSQYQTGSGVCSCRRDDTCTHPAYIYNGTGRIGISAALFGTTDNDSRVMFILPNIKVGCLPYKSLSTSTLQCFYDQSCLNSLRNYIDGFSLISPLKLTRFPPETLVNDLLKNLFVESWNEVYNFTKYYEICSPKLCTYSFDQSFYVLYMIVTIISFFGGLRIILFFSTPILVLLIRKIQNSIYHTNQRTNVQRNGNRTSRDRFKTFYRTSLQQIQTYNMFPSSNTIKEGLYSTRLYALLLTLGLFILIFYASISTQIRSITIKNPSFAAYEQLSRRDASTLTCPCSQISIKYSSIVRINAILHQVCLSDFIDDNVWLLYNSNLAGSLLTTDFRIVGMLPFRILQKLCFLSNGTITNELAVFNNLEFFTAQVLTNDTFKIQMSSIVEQFKQQTVASFYDLFQMIQTSIRVNHLANPGTIDSYMILHGTNDSDRIQVFFDARRLFRDDCSCGIHGFCRTNAAFYCLGNCIGNETFINTTVPDWFISCSPIDSLSISSLTCFYNASCVRMLIDAYSLGMPGVTINARAANVTPLNTMIKSRFTPSTRLDEIISALFIEEWIYSISFEKYFEECSPNECIYTYEERFNIAYIVATISGIVGGLSVTLRILVPLFVKSIGRIFDYRCVNNAQLEEEPSNRQKFSFFIMQLQNSFEHMNFYHRKVANQQLQTVEELSLIKKQCIATRFYIVVFFISIITLIIFLNTDARINSITIASPNLATFEELQNKYASTLTCPCSNIAILYSTFVSVQPVSYHQICSSAFISLDFITSLWGAEALAEYTRSYDRKILSSLFYALSSFCTLIKNKIKQNNATFSTQQLITLKTLTRHSFHIQVDAIIENFIVQTSAQFQWMHRYIMDMFHSNQLQHRFNLNWESFLSNADMNYIIRTFPIRFNESGAPCLCTTSPSQCFRSRLTSYDRNIRIPGIVFGCLPIDGLRQSTLECFYNATCINQLADFMNISTVPNTIDRSLPSRFNPISTVRIGQLIDELFVETWKNSNNYSNYYASCSPSSCHYTYVVRNNVVYMLTVFLALYGGLTVGLKLFVWYSLNIYWKIRQYFGGHCRENQVVPSVTN